MSDVTELGGVSTGDISALAGGLEGASVGVSYLPYSAILRYLVPGGQRGNDARRDLAPPSPLYSTPQ